MLAQDCVGADTRYGQPADLQLFDGKPAAPVAQQVQLRTRQRPGQRIERRQPPHTHQPAAAAVTSATLEQNHWQWAHALSAYCRFII